MYLFKRQSDQSESKHMVGEMSAPSFGEDSHASTEIQIEMPPLRDAPEGYHKLASAMGLFPDLAIFRRFSTLNTKNILYLQAELLDLERQLDDAARADALSNDLNRREYDRAWYNLSHAEDLPNGNGRQWKLFLRIREVLHQYSKWGSFRRSHVPATEGLPAQDTAILQQKELVKMVNPGREALSSVNEWMFRRSMGCICLIGPDRDLWSLTRREELLALDRSGCDDALSAWMTNSATTWFHWAVGRYFKAGRFTPSSYDNTDIVQKSKPAEFMGNTVYYSQKHVSRLTSIIVVSLSSILPLVSILVLSKVHNLATRLWIIGGCTVVFSLCLGLVASPRKVEIFSAAAA